MKLRLVLRVIKASPLSIVKFEAVYGFYEEKQI